jgi:hypothetical protein
MRVADWMAPSELWDLDHTGKWAKSSSDESKQADAIRPAERSVEQQKGKDKQARPKSKTGRGHAQTGIMDVLSVQRAACRVEGLEACQAHAGREGSRCLAAAAAAGTLE